MTRRFRWLSLFLLVCILIIYLFRNAGTYLTTPTGIPASADAMIILGGDAGARTLKSLELYNKGLVPRIVLTGLEDGEPDIQKHYLNWRAQTLISGGVPKESIEFDLVSRNSLEEAVNTLTHCRARGWRKVIVISDPPHMRRLNWVWSKTFKDSGIEFVLAAGTPRWWKAEKWWSNEASAKFVVNEYLKIFYYIVIY